MISSLVASTLHHTLTGRVPPNPTPTAAAGQGNAAPPVRGGSIASDIGQLTTDTLTLLGLGGGGTNAIGDKAAKAYATCPGCGG